jgi:head-tail adaptor
MKDQVISSMANIVSGRTFSERTFVSSKKPVMKDRQRDWVKGLRARSVSTSSSLKAANPRTNIHGASVPSVQKNFLQAQLRERHYAGHTP